MTTLERIEEKAKALGLNPKKLSQSAKLAIAQGLDIKDLRLSLEQLLSQPGFDMLNIELVGEEHAEDANPFTVYQNRMVESIFLPQYAGRYALFMKNDGESRSTANHLYIDETGKVSLNAQYNGLLVIFPTTEKTYSIPVEQDKVQEGKISKIDLTFDGNNLVGATFTLGKNKRIIDLNSQESVEIYLKGKKLFDNKVSPENPVDLLKALEGMDMGYRGIFQSDFTAKTPWGSVGGYGFPTFWYKKMPRDVLNAMKVEK